MGSYLSGASALPKASAAVAAFVIATGLASCGSSATNGAIFTAPPPPHEFASGLALSCIPAGYVFTESEGHESAVFHNFKSGDHAHLAIGRTTGDIGQIGDVIETTVMVDDREFFLVDDGKRLVEWVDPTVRIKVVSSDLPVERLSSVAGCLTYDPELDPKTP